MAGFSTAFGLCSVTDSRSLLGVTEDDDGCAIITLGKSMVIRCRLSDQKQLNSWSSTLAKLTSKVVWNAIDETYVGVFNDILIKQWTKQDPSLEKAKKHKFKNEIQEILSFSRESILKKPQLIILFKNGSARDLESGLSNSKDPMKDVISPQEVIELADIVTDNSKKYLIIVTKFENKYRQCYSVLLQEDNFMVTDRVKKIKLRRQGSSLLGFNILAGAKGNALLTLWSDGFLYSLPLPLESENPGVGKYLGAINIISRNFEVGIQPVSGDHIAIYGADPSEEGAFLGIYNVKFGVIQAQTSFKMLNKPPRMWLIDDNLVIVMGQRLVCVPFNLQTETLSGLVGSRALHADLKTSSEISALIPNISWIDGENSRLNKKPKSYPENIKEQLLTLSSEGWSEFGICQALMTDLIKTKDINAMLWCMMNFTDISEDHLVRMIQMALREDSNDAFKASSVGEELPETDMKSQFVNKVLSCPVDSLMLRKTLKEVFSFDDCMSFIRYINELLSDEGCHGDVPIENSSNVLDWTMSLVDAFYQQLILSRDSKVLELVMVLKERVEENVLCVKELKNLMPVVMRLKTGKRLGRGPAYRESYYLEKLRLYS